MDGMALTLRPMTGADAVPLHEAFEALGWDKPVDLFEGYARLHSEGERIVLVAEVDGALAGYCTLRWLADYAPFREAGIPEIVDLNVLPHYRRNGVGSALIDQLEEAAGQRSDVIGLGVGLYRDYGPAQRMYMQRGYFPDGRGIVYANREVEPGASVPIDDDACIMFAKVLR